VWAVRQALQAPNAQLLREMAERIARMKALARFRTDEQFEQYRQADLEFHQVLARMTRNPIYVHLIDFLNNLIRDSISISRELVPGDYGERNLPAHERIHAAIARQDAAAAEQAMFDHFALVEQYMRSAKIRKERPTPSEVAGRAGWVWFGRAKPVRPSQQSVKARRNTNHELL